MLGRNILIYLWFRQNSPNETYFHKCSIKFMNFKSFEVFMNYTESLFWPQLYSKSRFYCIVQYIVEGSNLYISINYIFVLNSNEIATFSAKMFPPEIECKKKKSFGTTPWKTSMINQAKNDSVERRNEIAAALEIEKERNSNLGPTLWNCIGKPHVENICFESRSV